MTNPSSWDIVLDLLQAQPLGVLGTSREGHAYTSLVAFVASTDARSLYFATTRATRKYHNLTADERVALLIDNRSNRTQDFYGAAAVSAYGRALEVDAMAHAGVQALYLARHPQLKSFVSAPSTALFRITVDNYQLVVRFQHVTEFRMTECTT